MEILMNETVQAFVDCINAHNVDGLAALMSDDHLFIDAHGNKVRGREAMTAGWYGYFEWFPDYASKSLRFSRMRRRWECAASPAARSKEMRMQNGACRRSGRRL